MPSLLAHRAASEAPRWTPAVEGNLGHLPFQYIYDGEEEKEKKEQKPAIP